MICIPQNSHHHYQYSCSAASQYVLQVRHPTKKLDHFLEFIMIGLFLSKTKDLKVV